ncbi:MAG: cya [Verrucomicrobia bacterium]|nr:cya [Verrucomicrobiota bacterium]
MNSAIQNEDIRTFQLLRRVKTAALSPEQQSQLKIAEFDTAGMRSTILVADDSEAVRGIVVLMLRSLGYRDVREAVDGRDALALMQKGEFDLLVLDIEMPNLDGYGVLAALKRDPVLRHVPVIVASGLDDLESVVRCIDLGAEDFLPKPVNSVILRARIAASLERKRLRDLEQLRLIELDQEKKLLAVEQEKSERLLLNILPASIAGRLKQGEHTIAERYADVSVLFADLVGFTTLVKHTEAVELVELLNDLFSRYDRIAGRLGLEKIKTIGDCYLVVGGLPEIRADHPSVMAEMALEMLNAMAEFNQARGMQLRLRIGMHTGPVVAGVIGHQKFAYDLWGATVNLASRLQSSGLPNRIHLSAEMGDRLRQKFRLVDRGVIACKGMGRVRTCLLEGKL